MVTNEGTTDQVITNITFNGNSIINLERSLPLGHIALAMSPDDMVDANNDGFAEMDLDIGTVSGVAIYNLSYDPTDIDGDGIANALDSDMDGDAIDDDQDIDLTVTNDSDGDGIDDSIDRDFVTAVAVETLPLSYTPVRGRLLASQCFQCHGTNGNSVTHWDSISGESASENLEEMNEYSVSHIMGAQAIGYTTQEKTDLSSYIGTLTRYNVTSITNISYEGDDYGDYFDEHDDDHDNTDYDDDHDDDHDDD
jgi:cytochrome c553